MKSKGEEYECAVFIDQLDEVRYWIRNIPRRPTSFSLPTSKGRFYPDFIVLLRDGRILVVEYKGAILSVRQTPRKRKPWATCGRRRAAVAVCS
jgi:type III restriction enzyme